MALGAYGVINEFANGGIIRHMVDSGYTIDEISSRLDFHTPKAFKIVKETILGMIMTM